MTSSRGSTVGSVRIRGHRIEAVLFDLDGVITDTAGVHARAWKRMFDTFLSEEAAGGPFEPFDIEHDYSLYVDGKPRYQGVASFLAARGITLAEGTPDDDPGRRTVCGLGNRKNAFFNDVLDQAGVEIHADSVAWLERLLGRGVKTACVSSSKNCRPVLERSRLLNHFAAIVDGTDIEREGLMGKPSPQPFLRAGALLGVAAGSCAVVEDAIAGVEAGRAGGFGLVIGLDRGAGERALSAAGAHVVVRSLGELTIEPS